VKAGEFGLTSPTTQSGETEIAADISGELA